MHRMQNVQKSTINSFIVPREYCQHCEEQNITVLPTLWGTKHYSTANIVRNRTLQYFQQCEEWNVSPVGCDTVQFSRESWWPQSGYSVQWHGKRWHRYKEGMMYTTAVCKPRAASEARKHCLVSGKLCTRITEQRAWEMCIVRTDELRKSVDLGEKEWDKSNGSRIWKEYQGTQHPVLLNISPHFHIKKKYI